MIEWLLYQVVLTGLELLVIGVGFFTCGVLGTLVFARMISAINCEFDKE